MTTPFELTTEEKLLLLQIARNSIQAGVPAFSDMHANLKPESPLNLQLAVFVTLKIQGNLRGCIGHVTPQYPLAEAVARMAVQSAGHDPRFSPVSAQEIPQLSIEISVLTPPVRIKGPEDILIGRHGLIIEKGHYRGLLLPQVATEQKWDAITFLGKTCWKAGLPERAWHDPDTTIESFEAIVFGELDTQ
jgi:AmmeMemoRadiSam system protein A